MKRWSAISKSSPTSGGSTSVTMYPENFGMTGAEFAVADAWMEIRRDLHRTYRHEDWFLRHPGVYVEMLPGGTRFRLVAFDLEGILVCEDLFSDWQGPVLERIEALHERKPTLVVRNRELLG